MISDLFCDGLGACIGTCPRGAITVVEREAEPYNEKRVMENIVRQGVPVVKAHLEHLVDHGETGLYNEAIEYLQENNIAVPDHKSAKDSCAQNFHACPGSAERSINRNQSVNALNESEGKVESRLRQWPVQLMLLNPNAPYFDNADLLIAADCVPFAYGNFHNGLLRDKIVITFCPKLDPHVDEYIEKMSEIFSNHDIKSITIARMEVPCCGGVNYVIEQALEKAGKSIPVKVNTISINGEIE